MLASMEPTVCRAVLYRSRTGKYSVPATITATQESLYRPGVEGGFVPDITAETNVHLTVLTPGIPGKRADADDFVARQDAPVAENVGGVYQEWDVPFWAPEDPAAFVHTSEGYELQPAGTWTWPPRG